jgi:hypothetical protein
MGEININELQEAESHGTRNQESLCWRGQQSAPRSRVPWDLEPRVAVLARAAISSKNQSPMELGTKSSCAGEGSNQLQEAESYGTRNQG